MSENATSSSSSPSAAPNTTSIPTSASSSSPTESPSSTPTAAAISPTGAPSQALPTDQDGCDCSSCSTTTTLQIVAPPNLESYLKYHIDGYQQLRSNIKIEVEVVETDEEWRALQQRLLEGEGPWDGAMFPAQLMGSLRDKLWELDDYLQTASRNDNGVLPFVHRSSMYGNTTQIMPLDGNTVRMFYRKDLFQKHNITVPRTWDEYFQAAQYFDDQTSFNIKGSCTCGLYRDWTFLILSSMTQTMGTPSGFLFDPVTSKPVWGDAMEETLRLFAQHGHLDNDCGGFERGECALTYTWDSTILIRNKQFEIGVAPTPGSSRVMDRVNGQLVKCTPSLCPYGEIHEDIGIVNRAPYAASGGWVSGVSNSTIHNRETADFFSYLQSQSFGDILPNERTNVLNSYQYEHTEAIRWINDAGVEPNAALEYTQSSRAINSLNAVMDLKVPNSEAFLNLFDEEVSSYMSEIKSMPGLERQEAINLREKTATRMTVKVENLIASEPEFVSSYQDSIGFVTAPEEAFNYIDEDYRAVALGMSGLICLASLSLIFWTILFRSNRVMKAFQPFLLIQCAVGVFLMGGTIILLGFDDQNFSPEFLDYTCMATPWAYVVGFTIFYSSVYCKIQECAKILKDPHKHKVLFVSPSTDVQFTLRLLFLNGSILTAWTVSDPLRWVRRELDGGVTYPDGTVETYGMCRGADFTSFALASVLYFLNLLILAIGIVRALKCRFLVMEYKELEWLTLSLLPFLEGWVVAGSVLALSRDDPTVVFCTFAFVVSVSSVCAGMAIFAPKDWYVRKHKYMETRCRKETEHTSASGILLLKHPKFEDQKQLDHVQSQLQETLTYNTELEIEIRGIKERFGELRYLSEQYASSQMTASQTKLHILTSPKSSRNNNRLFAGNKGERIGKTLQIEPIWKMPDDGDDTEVDISSGTPGPLESFSPLNKGQGDGSTKVPNGSSSKKNDARADGSVSDLNDLDNMVNRDDVQALGTKADTMANKFKTRAGTALIGDGIGGVRVISTEHANTGDKPNESFRDDENEEIVLESARESIGASSIIHYSGYEPSRAHTSYTSSQKAGEPSGHDRYTNEEDQRRLEGTGTGSSSKQSPPLTSNGILSPQDGAKKSGISFRTDTQFNGQESGPSTYSVGKWSAVGGTGGVLGDMSDSSSFSSTTSSAFSTTSMEATARASSMDTPFAKEIDNLVAKQDWDGVQLVTKTYEPSTAIDERRLYIEEKKRKKRELESSFGRSSSKNYSNQ